MYKTNPNIHIKQGSLILPNQQVEAQDLFISDKRILAIGNKPNNFIADVTIDAQDKWVIPSAVDLCAKAQDAETYAALAGGVSHICCPPDTYKINDSTAVTSLLREKSYEYSHVHTLPVGALTQGLNGEQITEMHQLSEAGCIAFSQLREPIKNTQTLLRCLEYASTFDLLIIFQSQINSLTPRGGAHMGVTATRLGLPLISEAAETIAIQRDLTLVEHTGVRAHFNQISCARSVELIKSAQERGLSVTADVNIHQLHFTDRDLEGFDSSFHTVPPLRSESDRQALIQGIQEGVISAICSNHIALEEADKKAPFSDATAGMSAFCTFLPLSYQLVRKNIISINQWADLISTNPSKILKLNHGLIQAQMPANICIFDPMHNWQLTEQSIISKGKNTPLLNQWITGAVDYMIKSGTVVYNRN